MITAPFNFVPLSDKVLFPDWSEQVSHDVPFSDSQSGVIDITITAKSPLFIRNHEVNGDKYYIDNNGNMISTEFCNHKGQYYIPGSSVKGMVRNVLEIMSFGKLKLDTKKHTKITSVRDMTNSKELVGTAKGCGFLKKDTNGEWIIIDYGKPRTIEYTNQTDKIIKFGNTTINCDFDTAKDKYESNGMYPVIRVITDTKDLINGDGNVIGNKNIATVSNNGEEAYLILTGGIDNKKNEFVFANSDRKENPIKNIDKAVSKFIDVYFNSDSVDGTFWKENVDENIGIPIFYIKDKNNNITDIGLSQLFKLAYNYTIDDATKQVIETVTKTVSGTQRIYQKLDLTESIFGAIQEEITKDNKSKKVNCALKGRVQFSHFKCNSNPEEFERITTVLGSPNPSFYPEYIQQNCKENGKVQNDKYNTLMDKTAKIAGWKRYPLRYGKPKLIRADEDTDSATTFTPIGTYNKNNFNEFTFSGKVRFHNLNKAELGALISALTFHNNHNNFYHNIGMAKSLGFGKIKIDLDTSKYIDALQEFEILMQEWTTEKLKKKWLETEQIKELFTMSFKDLNIDNKLKYLKLDPENNINEFVDAKNEKINREYVGRDCLPKVSQMFDISNNYPVSLLRPEVLEEREKIRELEDKKRKFLNNLNNAKKTKNIQILENLLQSELTLEEEEKVNDAIKYIKNEIQEIENQKLQEEANIKWEKIHHPSNSKYLKDALKKFIEDYPNSPKVIDAKKELENMSGTSESNKDNKRLEFSQAKDGKSIERVIKSIQNPTDNDKKELEEAIKKIYPTLNAKKKKQFIKSSKLMIKWLGQDKFNSLLE